MAAGTVAGFTREASPPRREACWGCRRLSGTRGGSGDRPVSVPFRGTRADPCRRCTREAREAPCSAWKHLHSTVIPFLKLPIAALCQVEERNTVVDSDRRCDPARRSAWSGTYWSLSPDSDIRALTKRYRRGSAWDVFSARRHRDRHPGPVKAIGRRWVESNA